MNVEVLLSTMHQKDLSIVDKMNIKGNAIIINQCDKNSYVESNKNNRNIKMYSFNERGVGKSRNNALMRSNADICLMADDDMVYVENYEEIVIRAFEKNPKADMIMFNVPIFEKNGDVTIKTDKNSRVRLFNSLKYGTVNIAFKREKIIKSNIFFSLLFGGGARYSSGEDSLFIVECLQKGIKIYSDNSIIANIHQGDSTWFTGYNQKYFFAKGAFFAAISKKFSYLLIFQFAIRKHSIYIENVRFVEAVKYMIEGLNHYNDIMTGINRKRV